MWRGSLLRYLVVFIVFAWSSTYGVPAKQYRDDYVYNPRNEAFYKLHIESVNNDQAVKVCEVEGASLMLPTTIYDTVFVHGLLKEYPDIGEYVWIGDDGLIHESAEEEPIYSDYANNEEQVERKCSVINRSGLILKHDCPYTQFPFVCKVLAKDISYDQKCQVYATGYKYYGNVSSCYKIPRIVFTWNQAFAECRSEGAHLVILNSEAERAAIQNLMTMTKYLDESHSKYYYTAGIRATSDKPRTFRTIFNQTLEEAGFAQWADTEPNNFNNNENCGGLYESDGKYNDQNCNDVYGFICEKEINVYPSF